MTAFILCLVAYLAARLFVVALTLAGYAFGLFGLCIMLTVLALLL